MCSTEGLNYDQIFVERNVFIQLLEPNVILNNIVIVMIIKIIIIVIIIEYNDCRYLHIERDSWKTSFSLSFRAV